MRRRLLNLLTVLSLLVCVAVLAVWGRSQFRADHIVYQGRLGHRSDVFWMFDVYTGNVRVYQAHYRFPPAERERFAAGARGGKRERLWSWTVMRYDNPRYTAAWPGRLRWNFSLPRFYSRPRTILWEVEGVSLVQRSAVLPFWTLVVLFAALPVARAGKALRAARRVTRCLCPACGYDLRASPGRCPECGTVTGRGSPP